MSKDGREQKTIKSLKLRQRNRLNDGLLDIDHDYEVLIEDINCRDDQMDAGTSSSRLYWIQAIGEDIMWVSAQVPEFSCRDGQHLPIPLAKLLWQYYAHFARSSS
jgi:hypothetical protein